MATLRLTIAAELTGAFFTPDQIPSTTIEATVADDNYIRRTLPAPAGADTDCWIPGGFTPAFWLLINNHATVSVIVGFTADEPMTLAPGQSTHWFGAGRPYVKGVGGDGSVIYWAIAAA